MSRWLYMPVKRDPRFRWPPNYPRTIPFCILNVESARIIYGKTLAQLAREGGLSMVELCSLYQRRTYVLQIPDWAAFYIVMNGVRRHDPDHLEREGVKLRKPNLYAADFGPVHARLARAREKQAAKLREKDARRARMAEAQIEASAK